MLWATISYKGRNPGRMSALVGSSPIRSTLSLHEKGKYKMSDENDKIVNQKRLATLYEDIITILSMETQQDHSALLAALIMHLRSRLGLSHFKIMFLLLQLVEDLENMIGETSELEELKKQMEEIDQIKERDQAHPAVSKNKKKSGWAMIQF